AEKVRKRIRLGLSEIRKMDVSVGYTNVATLDIVNSCLGGELLEDPEITNRGRQKLRIFEAFVTSNGTVLEYNSPTYLRVTMNALGKLIGLTQDRETRVRAKTLATRLTIGAALHIHEGTGRLAGPHSRAYQPTVACEDSPERNNLLNWIEEGVVPQWIGAVLDRPKGSYQIFETAARDWNMGLSTYLTPRFAMGVATRGLGEQSNVFMIHANRPESDKPGVVYSRYVVGDKWLGDFYHATDRSMSRNFNEEGDFWGVQNGPRAIGLYKPPALHYQKSAKAVLIWTRRDLIDETWAGDRKVEELPAEVEPGETVVVRIGKAYVGVRPLTFTDLGRNARIRLVEKAGDLVLELPNYQGPKKAFWELEWPGGFFKGHPQCGFYSEVSSVSDYPSGKEFAVKISEGTLTEKTDPPITYSGKESRLWSVDYTRDGQTVGIEVDLMTWTLLRRWTEEGDLGWPMLESPFMRQSASGEIQVGGATLTCGKHPAWLYADSDLELYAVGYLGETAPLSLNLPNGTIRVEAMSAGTLVWNRGKVEIESIDPGVQWKMIQ
ncbi:MAG: hypothetical protein KC964_16475, partial [Candidatus Omnitrophica bacterium]|nr:hypothetical protein [Candidatus Omnitrophota bacterium]